MAEGYQGLDKGYFVRKQSDLKWVQTFRMTLRSPAVANRIFDTKQHAIDFINDTSDSASAVEGLILAVYKDETFGNNGLYFVKSIKELVEDKDESGNTIFVEIIMNCLKDFNNCNYCHPNPQPPRYMHGR